MQTHRLVASLTAVSFAFVPLSAFAAAETTTTVSEEEVLELIDEASMPSMDRGGGGLYYPGPYGAGITVDASTTKEVTPDFVAVNGYCEVTGLSSRAEVRTELTNLYNAIKAAVGSDGRVRRSGTPVVYPYYDQFTGMQSDQFSGNLSIFIRLTRPAAAQRVSDILEEQNCSVNWDVRLVDTQDYELEILDDLLTKLNKRKTVFEKLLKKKLTNVMGASLYTWVDGYSTYDPDTNKADATTTLSITFDIGTRTRLTEPTAVPKG